MNYELIELFLSSGLSDQKLASETLGLNRTTISRLRSGDIKPKKHLIMLLRIMSGEVITSARYNFFNGWSFNNEFLFSPEGDAFTESDIRSLRYKNRLIKDYELMINDLKKQVDQLSQPTNEIKSNVIFFPDKKKRAT